MRMRTIRRIAAAIVVGGILSGCASSSAVAPKASAKPAMDAARTRRPNVIVIVADDLGYADIGIQGQSKDVRTPNIDSIASNGVRFTNGYVTCPVCSPTRAALMTGRYQHRFGHEFNPPPPPAKGFGISKDEVLLPEIMKKAGYATAMVGKWHLGMEKGHRPWDRGFDEYYGFLHGQHSYDDLSSKGGRGTGDAVVRARAGQDNAEEVPNEGYLTDHFGREAVGFIDRHKRGPFFLYLPFNAVHVPMEAPKEYLDRFQGTSDPKRRTMLAMLAAMDDAVGAVLQKLRSDDLEENTLIFFIADNGGPTSGNASRNDPFAGFKTDVLEGGVREPFFMQWKGQVPAGAVDDRPVISMDIFATSIAAVGAKAPTDRVIDGVDLMPYVKGGKQGEVHDYLFWRTGPQKAVRKGDYKYFTTPRYGTRLVNLKQDVREEKDISNENAAVLADLKAALAKWESELKPPAWGRAGATAPAAD